jgi:hypothetical protein
MIGEKEVFLAENAKDIVKITLLWHHFLKKQRKMI